MAKTNFSKAELTLIAEAVMKLENKDVSLKLKTLFKVELLLAEIRKTIDKQKQDGLQSDDT